MCHLYHDTVIYSRVVDNKSGSLSDDSARLMEMGCVDG